MPQPVTGEALAGTPRGWSGSCAGREGRKLVRCKAHRGSPRQISSSGVAGAGPGEEEQDRLVGLEARRFCRIGVSWMTASCKRTVPAVGPCVGAAS